MVQVLDWMAENLCVDMDRVFITGFSNGGQRGMLRQGGQGGQGGHPTPLASRLDRIPTHFLLNLYEI